MGWVLSSRSIATAFFVALTSLAVTALSQSAKATWYDSATGQPVHVTPRGAGNTPNGNQATIHDLNGHVRNIYWDKVCSTWRDSANGAEVHVTPRGESAHNENQATIHDMDGHVRNIYWTPCPSPKIGGSKYSLRMLFGFGATALVPHTAVSWLGTGTGGGVTSTFTDTRFMPTIEVDVPLTTFTVGATPINLAVTGNLLIPTQGTSTRNVMSGGFAGTESFRQDVAGSAFLQWAGQFNGPPVSFFDFFSVPAQYLEFYVGAGAAFDRYQAASVFPGAGDNFSVTHTDVVPAFEAGAGVNFAGGASAVLLFQDFLPGRSVTMPGGSTVSYGQAKAGNTLGFTGKITVPLTVFAPDGH